MADDEHRRAMQDDIGEAYARQGKDPHGQPLEGASQRQAAVIAEAIAAEEPSEGVRELSRWWKDRVLKEIDATVPKAIEYGSHDLVEMGRTLAYVMHREGISDGEAAELGIWFYQLGKMARWTNAIRNGVTVSDDTLLDMGVYVKMAQRVRDTGAWPGVELT